MRYTEGWENIETEVRTSQSAIRESVNLDINSTTQTIEDV
jgi:hypothetical protein